MSRVVYISVLMAAVLAVPSGAIGQTQGYVAPPPSTPNVFFEFDAGVTFSTFTNAEDGFTAISQELAALRYNAIGGGTDDSGRGFSVGGSANWQVKPNFILNTGLHYEYIGETTTAVTASRTNVSGTASNLNYTNDTTVELKVFNITAGPAVVIGPVTVNPSIVFGWGSAISRTSQRLLGGPPGTIVPTTEVSSDTENGSTTKTGVGWNTRVSVQVHERVGLYGQYQTQQIGGVYGQPNAGRRNEKVVYSSVSVGAKLKIGTIE